MNSAVPTGRRKIQDGGAFDHLFQPAKGKNITIKKQALLGDTIKWIQLVIAKTLDQTKALARHLQGARVKLTCKQIWNFCFHHYQYKRDEERKEQIRTPNRSWMDRKDPIGIDCDCFTVTICSLLENLQIPYVMRITKYEADEFEHIYPVAFTPEGEEIIIDCVVHEFNYEVPYTAKKDIPMDLEILNGAPEPLSDEITRDSSVVQERFNEFGEKVSFEHDLPIDAEDLFLDEEMELDGLEGRAEGQARKAARKAKRNRPKEVKKAERKAKRQEFVKNFKEGSLKDKIRTGFHVINKANPAAALLRAGILASMKLNLFKVASHLRFAYWSEAQARANDMDMNKFNQLQRIREKVEKIYFRAGGKAASLKKAILTGKGNRNKMVALNGLGNILHMPSDEDSLKEILGEDLFYEELNGFEGLSGLGEPATIATGAAVTAASGAMGVIAGLIKKLGSLFKKGSKSGEKFKIQDNTDNREEGTRKFSLKNIVNKVRTKIQERKQRKSAGESGGEFIDIPENEIGPPLSDEDMQISPEDEFIMDDPFDESGSNTRSASAAGDGKRTAGQWMKDNALWLGIGTAAAIGGTALTIYLVRKSKAKKAKALSGVKKPKKKKRPAQKAKKFIPRSRGRRTTASPIKIQPIT